MENMFYETGPRTLMYPTAAAIKAFSHNTDEIKNLKQDECDFYMLLHMASGVFYKAVLKVKNDFTNNLNIASQGGILNHCKSHQL